MRVLFFGDVVGRPGLDLLKAALPELLEAYRPTFVVANGENLELFFPPGGTLEAHLSDLEELVRMGVDAFTGGNHSFDPPWAPQALAHPRVLRPHNAGPHAPGRGVVRLRKGGEELLLVNLAGRSALPWIVEEPFVSLERILEAEGYPPTLVDLHSESVFEKMGVAYMFAGRVGALLGTHTHVPTTDARILPGGTAYVSDVGMVGPDGGMQGYRPELLVERLRSRRPFLAPQGASPYAEGPLRLSFVLVDLEGPRARGILHESHIQDPAPQTGTESGAPRGPGAPRS
ncbi:hypothetical protein Theos_2393 (plasmid) [Thermus oshimai JL-2]|uniref:Metallophosphoesterase, MG_246/BB_0505 family n=1 Tax=Thermus oshimai JL-2 TaxID=751945 RepID=K7R258_THEOS|nr:TIGR00282 family metallophosphoesterase [Thermus oshimai]AFV77375.1 hypothetical protein Theos_2393 [Thermus oshimai JL-2]